MRFLFGPFLLDTGTRTLLREGAPVHLPPKHWQLLELLLMRRPDAVSKDELWQQLWPGTFVTEASLARLVAELRQALGDDAREPRYLRTVHRFGYAFCGDCQPEAPRRGGAVPSAVHRLSWSGREVSLAPGENLLGRDRDAAVWLDDPSVSRHHVRIVVDGPAATLEDLGSKNGTKLHGEPVREPTLLADGDEILIGSVKATYRCHPDPEATRTARVD
jgi:DNA-binding winged helix-turn-helix (wHTH) protein